MSDSSKKYTVKETPVRSEKLKPVIKGSSDECRQVQDRMATYESLSVMRGNTLPELQVIGRFIESLPDRCKNIYSKTDNCEVLTYPLEDLDKHKGILELQEQAVEQKVNLHCKSLINSIPMYKWLLQDKNLVDRGSNCYELGIKRAIEDAKKSRKMHGKLLPMFKSRFGSTNIDYTEYVFNQVVSQGEDDVSTFSLKEYINFAEAYSKLLQLITDEDLVNLDHEEVVELASKIDNEPFTILVVEEYDDGERSPFEIRRFNAYTINSHKCSRKNSATPNCVDIIGEGVCHYSPEISVLVLGLPVLILFISAIIIPILSQLIGTLSIPENCLDSMTYLIAPLAFIIGIAMPFVIEVLPSIIGFELPKGNMELLKNLHFVVLIILIFRISPLVGMVLFCIRANLYTEYLREKWFLVIVTIGGVLGNLSWLILGMLMEMSYSGTLIFESFTEAYKNVFWGIQPEISDIANVPIVTSDSGRTSEYFFEESNFKLLTDLSIFISNATIFMVQSLLLSQYVSDVMCGRTSLSTYIGLPFIFIGSNISYGLLFFCFSCQRDTLFYWNQISFAVGLISIVFIELQNRFICRCNIRSRVKRQIDPSLEARENVPIDSEAKKYLATKNHKGMIKKLASKYGTPFVGVHREIVREIYQTTSEDKEEQFRLYAISGRRGTGKTRLVYECFKKPERESEFNVLQGEAAVKDDDKSKDMDLEDQDNPGSIKIQKCQPFEPIRKAIGNIVGINVFSSPSQQLSMIKNATDFAESFNGLSFLFSVDGKEEGGEDNSSEVDDSKQMSNVHVLAESLSKILIKEAKKSQSEKGKKLVLLLEDMEYADKNSLDFLKALIKNFANSYKSVPIVIVILYRELPGTDPVENNEGKIQEIVEMANKIAKQTGGVKKIKNLVDKLIDKKNKLKAKQKKNEEEKEEEKGESHSKGKDKEESSKSEQIYNTSKDGKIINEKNFPEKKIQKSEIHTIAKHYELKNLSELDLKHLCNSLCFVDEEVGDVSKWLFNKTKGKLYWVSVCLQNLFMERYVESTIRGWKLAQGKHLREIAIPNKMAQALESKFRKMDDRSIKLLQLAAESGMSFNSNLISKILDQSRLETIYELNRIQEEYNIITEHQGSAMRNDQGNDTLSGEFLFSSIVYVDAMRSMTRNYGNNLLYAKQIQLRIFDILFENVNMSQKFLNSFFFYMDRFEFENNQTELKFTLEERWGNAFIEITNFRKLPLEFKFKLAEHAGDSSLERPFEALIAYSMGTMTAKDLWDTPNIIKYSQLAISQAETIIQNVDEIDELHEWLKKQGRCDFSNEDEIYEFVKRLLSELLIIDAQNLLDSDPNKNSGDIIDKLDDLERKVGKLPPKALVIRAIAYAYMGQLDKSIQMSEEIYENNDVSKLYKADACYSACFAGYKDKNEEVWLNSIRCADRGIETMLEFIREEKKLMKSKKIRQQAKEIMGKLLLTKGMIYHFKFGNLKECEKCYIEALEYKKQINDVLGRARANGFLGKLFYSVAADLRKRNDGEHTYSTQNNIERSIKYFNEYYSLSSKIENIEGLIDAPKGLGNCYMELGDYAEAIKNYEKAVQKASVKNAGQLEVAKKVEALCQIIKCHILKGDKEKENDYKKYFDEVLEVCKSNPTNKKINNHRKGLMDFIDEQKERNNNKESNKFIKLYNDDSFDSEDYDDN